MRPPGPQGPSGPHGPASAQGALGAWPQPAGAHPVGPQPPGPQEPPGAPPGTGMDANGAPGGMAVAPAGGIICAVGRAGAPGPRGRVMPGISGGWSDASPPPSTVLAVAW